MYKFHSQNIPTKTKYRRGSRDPRLPEAERQRAQRKLQTVTYRALVVTESPRLSATDVSATGGTLY